MVKGRRKLVLVMRGDRENNQELWLAVRETTIFSSRKNLAVSWPIQTTWITAELTLGLTNSFSAGLSNVKRSRGLSA
jgi:hypothetical protein